MLLISAGERVRRTINPGTHAEQQPATSYRRPIAINAGPRPDRAAASPWRRTRDGWERVPWLADESPTQPPKMHPLALAVFQLVACGALAAFLPGRSQQAMRTYPRPHPAPTPVPASPQALRVH